MRRHASLLLFFAVFVLIPWAELFDAHFLLFNFIDGRFEFAFYRVEANTYQLIAAIAATVIVVALFFALSLSQIWCGKFCPNTLFLIIHEKLKNKTLISYVLTLFFAYLFSLSLLGYFAPIKEVFTLILNAENSIFVWFFYLLGILFFALVVLIKRWYCSYLCPYGALIAILPKSKGRSKIFVLKLIFIAVILLVAVVSYIFEQNNLEYCEFANKELHLGR
jgi:polyferredoxin